MSERSAPPKNPRGLAVVTGASSGIGFEFARCCADEGLALVLTSTRASIHDSAEALRRNGVPEVEAVVCDLSVSQGMAALEAALRGRPIEVLGAHVGDGLPAPDGGELGQRVDADIAGTLDLLFRIGSEMRLRGRGRILVSGPVAGSALARAHAVIARLEAFVDDFSSALRRELQDSGVVIVGLNPGAPPGAGFTAADAHDAAALARAASRALRAGAGAT